MQGLVGRALLVAAIGLAGCHWLFAYEPPESKDLPPGRDVSGKDQAAGDAPGSDLRDSAFSPDPPPRQ